MYYAIIENNIVSNVIVADEAFAQTLDQCVPYDEFNIDDTLVARIGEGYIDGKFVSGNQAVELGLLTADEALVFGFHSGREYMPPPKIDVVTMRQARLILLQYNLLASVQGIIDSLPSPQKEGATIEWEYASEVRRDSSLIQQLVPALSLTDEQMDSMFVEASML